MTDCCCCRMRREFPFRSTLFTVDRETGDTIWRRYAGDENSALTTQMLGDLGGGQFVTYKPRSNGAPSGYQMHGQTWDVSDPSFVSISGDSLFHGIAGSGDFSDGAGHVYNCRGKAYSYTGGTFVVSGTTYDPKFWVNRLYSGNPLLIAKATPSVGSPSWIMLEPYTSSTDMPNVVPGLREIITPTGDTAWSLRVYSGTTKLWKREYPSQTDTLLHTFTAGSDYLEFTQTPETIYVARYTPAIFTTQAVLETYDAHTGSLVATVTLPSIFRGTLAAHESRMWFKHSPALTGATVTKCVDIATGSVLGTWTPNADDGNTSSFAFTSDGNLLLNILSNTSGRNVVSVRPDGTEAWRIMNATDSRMASQIYGVDENALVANYGMFDASGAEKWRWKTTTNIQAATVRDDALVCVGQLII